MSALPEWATTLPGFDPERWHLPIVCTGRGSHAAELLGLIFDDGAGVRWAGLHVTRGERRELSDTERADREASPVRLADPERPSSLRRLADTTRPGSINFACPACGRTPRVPPDAWEKYVAGVQRVAVPWADVSALG